MSARKSPTGSSVRTFSTTPELKAGMLVVLGCGIVRLTTVELNTLGWSVWSYETIYGAPSFPYLSGSEYTKWETVRPL